MQFKETFNIDSIGFRIFAGFGNGEENKGRIASPISLFLFDMIKNNKPLIWGNGSQKRDFVYIEDIKNIIISSAEKQVKERVFNIGTGQATSFNEIINLLNKNLTEFGLIKTEKDPKFIDKPISYIEETCANTSLTEKTFFYKTSYVEKTLKKYLTYLQENKIVNKN